MKLATIVLSAFGLTGSIAGQNGNDPLIVNNRTALHVPIPVTPSPVRSNTFIKPTTSIECWRNGYPCGQNGGQRSQRLVADFIVPTPALEARVPPPGFFSTRTDVQVPGETDVPAEMPLDTLAPVPEPTSEVSMGILPIPTSLGGEPPKQQSMALSSVTRLSSQCRRSRRISLATATTARQATHPSPTPQPC